MSLPDTYLSRFSQEEELINLAKLIVDAFGSEILIEDVSHTTAENNAGHANLKLDPKSGEHEPLLWLRDDATANDLSHELMHLLMYACGFSIMNPLDRKNARVIGLGESLHSVVSHVMVDDLCWEMGYMGNERNQVLARKFIKDFRRHPGELETSDHFLIYENALLMVLFFTEKGVDIQTRKQVKKIARRVLPQVWDQAEILLHDLRSVDLQEYTPEKEEELVRIYLTEWRLISFTQPHRLPKLINEHPIEVINSL